MSQSSPQTIPQTIPPWKSGDTWIYPCKYCKILIQFIRQPNGSCICFNLEGRTLHKCKEYFEEKNKK